MLTLKPQPQNIRTFPASTHSGKSLGLHWSIMWFQTGTASRSKRASRCSGASHQAGSIMSSWSPKA